MTYLDDLDDRNEELGMAYFEALKSEQSDKPILKAMTETACKKADTQQMSIFELPSVVKPETAAKPVKPTETETE